MKAVRLDRMLSKLRIASRQEAQGLIRSGSVRVDDRIVLDPAFAVISGHSRIAVEGREHSSAPAWRTLLFYKPRGVVTTRRDPEGRRTVFDVLGEDGASMVAVGRLDMATTGLLILTTDTQLADALTDPEHAIVRRYAVTVRGRFTEEARQRLLAGVDGMRAHSVVIRKPSGRETHLIIELTEGRNREIRRLCKTAGHEVTALKRIAFGGLELGRLKPGEWREVSRQEIAALGW